MYLNIQTGSMCSIKNLIVGSMDIGESFQSKSLEENNQMSYMLVDEKFRQKH
jgi:hypothetical protein